MKHINKFLRKLKLQLVNKKTTLLIVLTIVLYYSYKLITNYKIENFEDEPKPIIRDYELKSSEGKFKMKISYPGDKNEMEINDLELKMSEKIVGDDKDTKLTYKGKEIKPRDKGVIENEEGIQESIKEIKGADGVKVSLSKK
jgi:hypothetical protein